MASNQLSELMQALKFDESDLAENYKRRYLQNKNVDCINAAIIRYSQRLRWLS
jgi:hypothetical protein